jgi:hypothetical protein
MRFMSYDLIWVKIILANIAISAAKFYFLRDFKILLRFAFTSHELKNPIFE